MSTKTDIIDAIKAAADAYYTADPETGAPVAVALGTPGAEVEIAGQTFDTGKAWENEPKSIPTQIEGLADYLDTQGLSDVAAVKSKLNELIGAYNQLLADYNNGVVPSTALPVTPI